MVDKDDQQVEHEVNGADPTDEEARLAAQVHDIGDDPKEEPDDKTEDKVEPESKPNDDAGAQGAEDDGAENGEDAADGATADEAASPAPAAAGPPPKPEPPKDFDAEYEALQRKYDDGDLDDAEFQKAQRELAREEGKYTAAVTVWEQRIEDAAASASAAFNQVALAWETENKDFVGNPLRAKAMQDAINSIDEQTNGTLAPAELFARAEKVAFEAFNYKPAGRKPDKGQTGDAEKVKQATEARKPGKVPQSLGRSPSAAPIEAGRNSSYDELDGLDVSDLEDALSRMTPDQKAAYLRDAPGADATSA